MRLPPRNRSGQFRRPRRRSRSRRGGFALGKILPLALVGGAVWYFFLRKPAALPAPAAPGIPTDTSAETQIMLAQQAAQNA